MIGVATNTSATSTPGVPHDDGFTNLYTGPRSGQTLIPGRPG